MISKDPKVYITNYNSISFILLYLNIDALLVDTAMVLLVWNINIESSIVVSSKPELWLFREVPNPAKSFRTKFPLLLQLLFKIRNPLETVI